MCEQQGVWNWEFWCNEIYDRLHREANAALDEEERAKRYVRMQDLMVDSGAYLFVCHPPLAALSRKTLVPATLPNGRLRLSLFEPA